MFFHKMNNKLFGHSILFTKIGSTYHKQKIVIAIIMNNVPPNKIPMTIPVISPADSESSETV